jgi:hypothetical protein
VRRAREGIGRLLGRGDVGGHVDRHVLEIGGDVERDDGGRQQRCDHLDNVIVNARDSG